MPPLLHPAHKTRLNKICTKQNRCIRSMFFAHGREHVNPYYNLLGILKLENIYRLKVSLFTYKLKNDKSNTYLYSWIFSHRRQRFPHIIPGILQIKTSLSHQYTHNSGIPTFKFSAIKIWESVPPEFKRFTYMLFKKRHKRFLSSTQNWP